MSWRRVVVVLGAVSILLSGCSEPDKSAVPTEAKDPFVCAGVPAGAAELILGGGVVKHSSFGEWGLKDEGFQCAVGRDDGGSELIQVQEWAIATKLGGNADDALSLFAAEADATKIDAGSDGAGYVAGTSESGSASWACGERMLTVDLIRVETEGRDQRADAQALLVSMLPWACGGERAPAQTAAK